MIYFSKRNSPNQYQPFARCGDAFTNEPVGTMPGGLGKG